MKKLIFCIFVYAVLTPFVAFGAPTKKIVLTEFCELYGYRSGVFDETFNENNNLLSSMNMPAIPFFENGLLAFSGAGTMHVVKDDLTIQEASFTMMDLADDNDASSEKSTLFRCIIGLSALEISASEESLLSITSNLYGGPKNATEKAMEIWENDIMPALSDDILAKIMENPGERILIYSGNYDYYVNYYESTGISGNPHEYIGLNALARTE